jgi:hypothetical protein
MNKNTLNKKVNRVNYALQDIKDALCIKACISCTFYQGVRDINYLDKTKCLFHIITEKLNEAKEDYE